MPDANEKQNKYTFTKIEIKVESLYIPLPTLGTVRSLDGRIFW